MMKRAQQLRLPNKPFTASWAQAASISSSQGTVLLTSVCWSAFFCYSVVYCFFYTKHIDGSARSIFDSAEWAFTEYGLWLLLAPALIMGLQRFYLRGFLVCIAFCSAAILLANYLRVSLDIWLKPEANWVASWVYYWPTQVAAACYSVLGWVVLLLLQGQSAAKQPSAPKQEPAPADQNTQASAQANATATLTVQTGTSECELAIDDIEYVVAAGNYMEVITAERTYLLRETLKTLPARLAPEGFVRSHRSYLVNRAMIAHRTADKLILRSGASVPLSTRYGRFFQ